jgi:hypothetical protein
MPSKKDSNKGTKELLSLAVGKSMKPKADKRKIIKPERISLATPKPTPKEIIIRKGKGSKLADIPNVAMLLAKFKSSDPVITLAHRIIFGTPGRTQTAKKHLREFSGFVYDEDFKRENLIAKLSLKLVPSLRELSSLFCLDKSGSKEELVDRLVAFLEKPHETDVEPAARKRSRSPSPTRSRSRSPSPAKKKSKKEDSESEEDKKKTKKSKKVKRVSSKDKGEKKKRPLSAYFLFTKDVRPAVTKKHPTEPVTELAKIMGEMWKKT